MEDGFAPLGRSKVFCRLSWSRYCRPARRPMSPPRRRGAKRFDRNPRHSGTISSARSANGELWSGERSHADIAIENVHVNLRYAALARAQPLARLARISWTHAQRLRQATPLRRRRRSSTGFPGGQSIECHRGSFGAPEPRHGDGRGLISEEFRRPGGSTPAAQPRHVSIREYLLGVT